MFHRAASIGLLVVMVCAAQGHGAVSYSQTQSGAVGFPDSTPVVLTFTGTPAPLTDATLTLIATGGELANDNKRLEQLKVEGAGYQTPGQPAGWMLPVNFLDGSQNVPAPVTISLADLAGFAADGQVQVSVVRPGFIAGGTFDVVLAYRGVPEPASVALMALGGVLMLRRRSA